MGECVGGWAGGAGGVGGVDVCVVGWVGMACAIFKCGGVINVSVAGRVEWGVGGDGNAHPTAKQHVKSHK